MTALDLRGLLADPLHSGAYFVDLRDTEAMAEAGAALDFAVARADLRDCADKPAVLARLGQALQFPDWFGGNWDALADSLGDLSWLPAPGYLLLVEHAGDWREADGEGFDTLLAILGEAATDWRERNVAFWVLLPLPAEALQRLDA
ncbi:MAG: barstar family protein [Lysobacter sp.]